MIFEAKQMENGTWQVYGSLPEHDRTRMVVEFASLATICREKPEVLEAMIEAFEQVETIGEKGSRISVLFQPQEKGGMA